MDDPATPADAPEPQEGDPAGAADGAVGEGIVEAGATEAVVAGADAPQLAKRSRRSRFYLRGRKLRLPQSRGGLAALLMIAS
ncbi:MAG TPA: hypothetical protein VFQ75_02400, partial [Candidatus Limnocylindrales bacterium]|nr:hypothetical protein [Candidatus Limnocylindrales bacterium]